MSVPVTVVYSSEPTRSGLFEKLSCNVDDKSICYNDTPSQDKFLKHLCKIFKTKKDVLLAAVSSRSEEFLNYLRMLDKTIPDSWFVRIEKWDTYIEITGITKESNTFQSFVERSQKMSLPFTSIHGENILWGLDENLILYNSEYTGDFRISPVVRIQGGFPIYNLSSQGSFKIKSFSFGLLDSLDYANILSYLKSVNDLDLSRCKVSNLSLTEFEKLHKLFSTLHEKGDLDWDISTNILTLLPLEQFYELSSELFEVDKLTYDTGFNTYSMLEGICNVLRKYEGQLNPVVEHKISSFLGKYLQGPILYNTTVGGNSSFTTTES